jgi:RsiW-degrading membrane proteinase PrsW (M82 family)
MHHLIATLSTLGFAVRERARAALGEDRDSGASTIEIVFWSAGLLVLAGLVYAAIQAYVTSKIPGIR